MTIRNVANVSRDGDVVRQTLGFPSLGFGIDRDGQNQYDRGNRDHEIPESMENHGISGDEWGWAIAIWGDAS
jgi:hypothetical protein